MQPLLGLNEEGKLTLYSNPYGELNPWGDRCARGEPFPQSYFRFRESGVDALQALHDLTNYARKAEKRKILPRTAPAQSEVRQGGGGMFRSRKKG